VQTRIAVYEDFGVNDRDTNVNNLTLI